MKKGIQEFHMSSHSTVTSEIHMNITVQGVKNVDEKSDKDDSKIKGQAQK